MDESSASRRAPRVDSRWSDEAKRLWRETFALVPADEWRPDEVDVLRQLCNVKTELAAVVAAIEGTEMYMTGAGGGTIANPLLSERRQLRRLELDLIKALRLPAMKDLTEDELEGDDLLTVEAEKPPRKMTKVEAAKKAANDRWGNT